MEAAWDIAWNGGNIDERRFRRILLVVVGLCLLLSVGVALSPAPAGLALDPGVPKRTTRLILKPPPPPPPPPAPEVKTPEPVPPASPVAPEPAQPTPAPLPPAVAKPADKVAPPPASKPTARDRASQAGLVALQDNLADLRAQSRVPVPRAQRRVTEAVTRSSRTERSLLTSNIASGSGGVASAALSREAGTTHLEARATEVLSSDLAGSAPLAAPAKEAATGGRTDAEIQRVFDRHKSPIYNLYNRALRTDPSLAGTFVVQLTIAPSGAVVEIELVDTELADRALVKKLLLRIKRFDFGAKAVAMTSVTYTMDFYPS